MKKIQMDISFITRGENVAFDTWHMTMDAAFQAAYSQYGVKREHWIVMND